MKRGELASKEAEEFARQKRRAEVTSLYLKGLTQAAIAGELGVSVHTVAKDLDKVRRGWVEQAKMEFEERKAQELAKVDHIEAMAWRGWEASLTKQEVQRTLKETVRQVQRNSENKVIGHKMVPVKVVEETVVKGSSGDPRFLEQAAKCVEMRLRILGLWKQDSVTAHTVQLDWAKLFEAQQARADRSAQEHERALLGHSQGVLQVVAVDAEEDAPAERDVVEERLARESNDLS